MTKAHKAKRKIERTPDHPPPLKLGRDGPNREAKLTDGRIARIEIALNMALNILDGSGPTPDWDYIRMVRDSLRVPSREPGQTVPGNERLRAALASAPKPRHSQGDEWDVAYLNWYYDHGPARGPARVVKRPAGRETEEYGAND